MRQSFTFNMIGLLAMLGLAGCQSTAGTIGLTAVTACVAGVCTPEGREKVETNIQHFSKNMDLGMKRLTEEANVYATNARESAYKLSYQVEDWVFTPPEVKRPNAIEQTYCYRSLQDVMCYHSPMPGAEHRLIAYQGTFAEPPPPVRMKLLPTHEFDPSQTPENRIANASPVFVDQLPDVKEDMTSVQGENNDMLQAVEIIPERPNPALVPQL